jgi:Possible lysine decarboxylase
MGIVADAVLEAGGTVTGVIPDFLVAKEIAHPDLTDLKIVSSIFWSSFLSSLAGSLRSTRTHQIYYRGSVFREVMKRMCSPSTQPSAVGHERRQTVEDALETEGELGVLCIRSLEDTWVDEGADRGETRRSTSVERSVPYEDMASSARAPEARAAHLEVRPQEGFVPDEAVDEQQRRELLALIETEGASRGDDEGSSAFAREEPARCQEQPVDRRHRRTAGLPT